MPQPRVRRPLMEIVLTVLTERQVGEGTLLVRWKVCCYQDGQRYSRVQDRATRSLSLHEMGWE